MFYERVASTATSPWVASLPILKTAMVLGGGLGAATGAGLVTGLIKGNAVDARDHFRAMMKKERQREAETLRQEAEALELQAKNLRDLAENRHP